jgi:hypothetical protein
MYETVGNSASSERNIKCAEAAEIAMDANGNLLTLTGAATTTYTYDYRNRLTQVVTTATSTYLYDHTTARMRQTIASTTTDYPNKFYIELGCQIINGSIAI